MRHLLLFSAAIIFISPAMAQENMIRVVGEDGTVQEIELKPARSSSIPRLPKSDPPPKVVQPPPPPEPALPPIPDVPEIKTEMPAQLKAIVEPLPETEPAPQEVELYVEPSQDVQEERAGSETQEPVEAAEEELEQAAESTAAEPDEVVEWNQEERVGAAMIKPGRKPVVPYRHAKPDYSNLKPAQPTGPITKEQAIAIAMEDAPPASSVIAIARAIDGRPVYVVTFRTEDGPLDIVVDIPTGEILR